MDDLDIKHINDCDTIIVNFDDIIYEINAKALIERFNNAFESLNNEIAKASKAANALADNLGYSDEERKEIVYYVCEKAKMLHEHDDDKYNEFIKKIGKYNDSQSQTADTNGYIDESSENINSTGTNDNINDTQYKIY